MRNFTSLASEHDRRSLDLLSDVSTSVCVYRDAMRDLGKTLGESIVSKIRGESPSQICLVCTVEDADSLGVGLLSALSEEGLGDRVRLVCFWNQRIELGDESVAPIVKEYREPCEVDGSILIVLKSIIASSCVVRTNLSNMIGQSSPKRIFVAAPVMLCGAEERLSREFLPEVSAKFEYHTLAVDDEVGANKWVIPGVGGDVYTRLGFNGAEAKNRYVPRLVKERRSKDLLAA